MSDAKSNPLAYLEIPVDNVERAKRFFGTVFGWSSEDHPAMNDYAFFDSGPDGIGGGFRLRGGPFPPVPVAYIMCEDLAKAVDASEMNGGAVLVAPTPFGTAGTLALIRDTEGNVIGLWQAARAM